MGAAERRRKALVTSHHLIFPSPVLYAFSAFASRKRANQAKLRRRWTRAASPRSSHPFRGPTKSTTRCQSERPQRAKRTMRPVRTRQNGLLKAPKPMMERRRSPMSFTALCELLAFSTSEILAAALAHRPLARPPLPTLSALSRCRTTGRRDRCRRSSTPTAPTSSLAC